MLWWVNLYTALININVSSQTIIRLRKVEKNSNLYKNCSVEPLYNR